MKTLQGIRPAIITPFGSAGAFDAVAWRSINTASAAGRRAGFYVGGGTGEDLLLTRPERQLLLENVIEEVQGQALVMAHVGAFQTTETIALARHASDLGLFVGDRA